MIEIPNLSFADPLFCLESPSMKHQNTCIPALFAGFILLISACTENKQAHDDTTSFTPVDSATERYLNLQDSLLIAWNMMISDDHHKFRNISKVLSQFMESPQYEKETLMGLQQRLDQLKHYAFTPENINRAEFIEEYDFTTQSLVTEVISLAEKNANFAENKKLQKMVEEIRLADQRVERNRAFYDQMAYQYNRFLESNKHLVKEIDQDISLEKKPLFQMVAGD